MTQSYNSLLVVLLGTFASVFEGLILLFIFHFDFKVCNYYKVSRFYIIYHLYELKLYKNHT